MRPGLRPPSAPLVDWIGSARCCRPRPGSRCHLDFRQPIPRGFSSPRSGPCGLRQESNPLSFSVFSHQSPTQAKVKGRHGVHCGHPLAQCGPCRIILPGGFRGKGGHHQLLMGLIELGFVPFLLPAYRLPPARHHRGGAELFIHQVLLQIPSLQDDGGFGPLTFQIQPAQVGRCHHLFGLRGASPAGSASASSISYRTVTDCPVPTSPASTLSSLKASSRRLRFSKPT